MTSARLWRTYGHHYTSYINDLCHLHGTKLDTRWSVVTLSMFSYESINLPLVRWKREFLEERREKESPPTCLSLIYFLQRARKNFLLSSCCFSFFFFFNLPRRCKYRRARLKNRVTSADLTVFLRKLLARKSIDSFIWSSLPRLFARSPNHVCGDTSYYFSWQWTILNIG